jgi:hypothetical protein
MTIDAYPIAIKLTDSAGASLTEHSYVTNAYSITGAGPHYFYLPTTMRAELTGLRFWNSSAQTLSVKLEIRTAASTWQEIPAFTSGVIAADGSSENINTSYPLRAFLVPGVEMRLAATVGGATTTAVQAVCVAVR